MLCDGAQRDVQLYHAGATGSSDAVASAGAVGAPPADASGPRPEAADASTTAAAQQVPDGDRQPAAAPRLTAAEAWAALQLYTASTGKYAAGGSAFMAPVYGVGELPQARRLQRVAPKDIPVVSAHQRTTSHFSASGV